MCPMKKTLSIAALSLVFVSALLAGVARGATPAPSGLCSPEGSKTTISGKSYTCTKVLSGKTVWIAGSSTLSNGQKPAISGGQGRGPFGDEGSAADIARHASMKKYSDCLVKNGGSAFSLRRGEDHRFQSQRVQPSTSATQQKAMSACASLAPKFSRPPGDDH